jgi:hypothetical protein
LVNFLLVLGDGRSTGMCFIRWTGLTEKNNGEFAHVLIGTNEINCGYAQDFFDSLSFWHPHDLDLLLFLFLTSDFFPFYCTFLFISNVLEVLPKKKAKTGVQCRRISHPSTEWKHETALDCGKAHNRKAVPALRINGSNLISFSNKYKSLWKLNGIWLWFVPGNDNGRPKGDSQAK